MFDTIGFLKERFGNADGVVGLFNAYCLDIPPKDTVRKWFERGSVPSEWFPLLVVVAEIDGGEPVRLASFIKKGDGNAKTA